jgi:hypothetical protein
MEQEIFKICRSYYTCIAYMHTFQDIDSGGLDNLKKHRCVHLFVFVKKSVYF